MVTHIWMTHQCTIWLNTPLPNGYKIRTQQRLLLQREYTALDIIFHVNFYFDIFPYMIINIWIIHKHIIMWVQPLQHGLQDGHCEEYGARGQI